MTLYFKLDHKFRIWLLFCSSLKIKDVLLKDEKDSFHRKNKPLGTSLHRSIEIFGIENTEKENMKLIQSQIHIDGSSDAIYAFNPRQKACSLCFSKYVYVNLQNSASVLHVPSYSILSASSKKIQNTLVCSLP
jgi:hypothetical protein